MTDTLTQIDAADDVWHKAWVDGEDLVGDGIVNDKGPLAAFLMAAKAIKNSGLQLKGDLLLTGVIAETSHEPCDDEPGTYQRTLDLGTRYLMTHGGIADYVLVAEGTGFSLVSVEAGMIWLKVTWTSEDTSYYTPYLPDRTTLQESPNMIVRASLGVAAVEEWAASFQARYSVELDGGPVVPKAQIGAIRSGDPHRPNMTPQICSIYIGVFTPPGHELNPLDIRDDLANALIRAEVPAEEVEIYLFRRGYEAKGVDRLRDSVYQAHLAELGSEPPPPDPATSSMWRDLNIYNEVGIPAMTYGPRSKSHMHRRALSIDSLHQAARIYARTMLDVCMQEKAAS